MRELRRARLQQRQQRLEPGERFPAMRPGARVVGAEEHVVLDAEKGKEAPPLKDVGDAHGGAAMRRRAVNAPSLEADMPDAWLQQPGDRVDERRFAGAVRAEKRDDLAGRDADLRVPQHLEIAVSDVEVLDGELGAGAHYT